MHYYNIVIFFILFFLTIKNLIYIILSLKYTDKTFISYEILFIFIFTFKSLLINKFFILIHLLFHYIFRKYI
jgi:hypothetical protein